MFKIIKTAIKKINKLTNAERTIHPKLQKDIHDISQLSSEISEISLLQVELPKIRIQINVWCPINKKTQKRGFQFYIIIPEKYPHQQPIFETTESSDKPFHPCFHSNGRLGKFKSGIWNPKKSLAQYILDLAHLLQYDTKYIKDTCEIINSHILDTMRDNNNIEKIERIELPNSIEDLFSKKKFAMEKNINLGNSKASDGKLTNKKFEIDSIKKAYVPSKETIEDEKINVYMSSDFRTYKLMIKPDAFNSIRKHIDWNKPTNNNKIEQGGILIGYVKHDVERKVVLGIVEEAIHGKAAVGTHQSLRMSHDVWKQMIDQADNIAQQRGKDDLQIIGWYHTHPKNLDVFMSETDMATQKRFFAHDWQFAIVLNPHKAIWKVFHGRFSKECEGIIGEYLGEDSPPQIQILDTPKVNDLKKKQNKTRVSPKTMRAIFISLFVIIMIIAIMKFLNFSQNSTGVVHDIESNKKNEQKSLTLVNNFDFTPHQVENFDTTFSMLLNRNLNLRLDLIDSTYMLYSSPFPIGSLNVDISTQFNKTDSLISNFMLKLQLSSKK